MDLWFITYVYDVRLYDAFSWTSIVLVCDFWMHLVKARFFVVVWPTDNIDSELFVHHLIYVLL